MPPKNMPASLEERLGLLLEYLREEHALLVLDNPEALLEEGAGAGHMRPGYEGYVRYLAELSSTEQQRKSLDNPRRDLLYYLHANFIAGRLLTWISLKVLDCSLINWLMRWPLAWIVG